jgi:glycerophosphoryl diester phosphodiesterase
MSVLSQRTRLLTELELVDSRTLFPGPRPLVIAHRGASAYAPEHTFASWDRALAMGADFIEQDLQMTADGVLVVLHDATLDRTVRGPDAIAHGRLDARTLAELDECEAGSWFNDAHPDRARPEFAHEPIPTLDAVLARYAGRARFYIETKNPEEAPGMEEELVRLLREHDLVRPAGVEHRVIVQSFSTRSLRTVRALEPSIPLVRLFRSREKSWTVRQQLPLLADLVFGIGPASPTVDDSLVRDAARHGLVVHPYTVDAESEMRRLIHLGVDAMFTNMPDRLLAVRR